MAAVDILKNKSLIPIIVSWKSINEAGKNTAIYNNVFSSPLILDPSKAYGIALETLDTYYSFPNMDPSNNIFTYTKGGVATTLTLPIGTYDISTIASTISTMMGADAINIVISVVPAQLKTSIKIGPNFTVDFTVPNSINTLLGFNSEILYPATNISENIANINVTNTVFVNCDLITSSYVNGINSPVIYTFFPDVTPGYKIVKESNNLNFVKINKTQINSIKVWLTNQNGVLLNFRGETITIRFYICELF